MQLTIGGVALRNKRARNKEKKCTMCLLELGQSSQLVRERERGAR
jgi:hypothetical protein